MSAHWKHLESSVGSLSHVRILDLGCGTGWFLIEAAQKGASATGLETSADYIEKANAAAKEAGASIRVEQGMAEALPFGDDSFDFANVNEVIEHVEDPKKTLEELYRVLAPGGSAYVSVPNRFGFKDQHYHLYLVNWLPRSLSEPFISLFGRQKDYAKKDIGAQRLSEMHYYTFGAFQALAQHSGFKVTDMRLTRI